MDDFEGLGELNDGTVSLPRLLQGSFSERNGSAVPLRGWRAAGGDQAPEEGGGEEAGE